MTARAVWMAGSGSGDVVWGLRGRVFADGDDLDQALGTGQTVTDTLTGAGKLLITAETPAITLAGSSADHVVALIELFRAAANAADTLTADALLLGAWIYYSVAAATDL